MAIQQVTGKVIKKKVSEGSKSERDAVRWQDNHL
jgi:hypothetical protein